MQHAGTVRITSTPATSPSPTPSVERVARQGAALVRMGALRQSWRSLQSKSGMSSISRTLRAPPLPVGPVKDQEISTGWDGFHHIL